MKQGKCPKCGSANIYSAEDLPLKSGPFGSNSIPVTLTALAALDNYVCVDCGLVESYVADLSRMGDVEALAVTSATASQFPASVPYRIVKDRPAPAGRQPVDGQSRRVGRYVRPVVDAAGGGRRRVSFGFSVHHQESRAACPAFLYARWACGRLGNRTSRIEESVWNKTARRSPSSSAAAARGALRTSA